MRSRQDETTRRFGCCGWRRNDISRFRPTSSWPGCSHVPSRPAAALDSLSKARALAPNSEDVLSAYAQLSLAVKQPMPAVLALQSLTRMCPSVSQYHYLLGVGLMAIGDMPSAVEALTEADRLEPERALTLLALGLALNNRKHFADARTTLVHSLELQPESIEAVAALAEAEVGSGKLRRRGRPRRARPASARRRARPRIS